VSSLVRRAANVSLATDKVGESSCELRRSSSENGFKRSSTDETILARRVCGKYFYVIRISEWNISWKLSFHYTNRNMHRLPNIATSNLKILEKLCHLLEIEEL
jgi:hypothetical protein